MKKTAYLRILLLSVFSALVLTLFSLLCLIKFSEVTHRDFSKKFLLFIAQSVESNPQKLSLPFMPPRDHSPGSMPPPPPPGFPPQFGGQNPPPFPHHKNSPQHKPNLPPPPQFEGAPRDKFVPAELWIITDQNQILVSNTNSALIDTVKQLPKPNDIHQIVSNESFFRLSNHTFITKLDREPNTFLVLHDRNNPFRGYLFLVQAVLTFATVVVALFLALSISFFYLRRKSEEARAVLLRMERGDLKARFKIERFDEFSGLLLDFNRMAEEIERLVNHIHVTETTRANLLQELGHDLRTPLTSLTTSFETIKFHHDKMSVQERGEILLMIEAEISYFKDLLEKLMAIAELDNPHYKKTTTHIDLSEFVQQEVKSRQNSNEKQIKWNITEDKYSPEGLVVLGDTHLLQRLFKNAFDNSIRFTNNSIQISLTETESTIQVQIIDNGPGIDEKTISTFAKRRERRKKGTGSNLNFSLGLGSVIMKSIVDLHNGSLEIKNHHEGNVVAGAILVITFPKVKIAAK